MLGVFPMFESVYNRTLVYLLTQFTGYIQLLTRLTHNKHLLRLFCYDYISCSAPYMKCTDNLTSKITK